MNKKLTNRIKTLLKKGQNQLALPSYLTITLTLSHARWFISTRAGDHKTKTENPGEPVQ